MLVKSTPHLKDGLSQGLLHPLLPVDERPYQQPHCRPLPADPKTQLLDTAAVSHNQAARKALLTHDHLQLDPVAVLPR